MSPGLLDFGAPAGLDAAALAPVFARLGRMHLPGILPPAAAQAVHASLRSGDLPWRRHLHAGASVSIPLAEFEARDGGWRAEVDAAVRREAAAGFVYRFDSFPVSDELEAGRRRGLAVEAVYDAFNTPAFLRWMRRLTGEPRIAYCDAQATRYRCGDFLTRHDDDVEGKNRLFAYVLNLTPGWRADWGGLLLFIDGDGHVAEGYTPAFNALNLFRVPQAHLVSEVASFSPEQRLAVTGWVRSRRD